jgi:hypothetical protein
MLIEEVFPHVKLLVGELRDRYLKLDHQVASDSLIVDQSALSHKVFGVLDGRLALSVHSHRGAVQVLKISGEAEQGFLEGYAHQVNQIVPVS